MVPQYAIVVSERRATTCPKHPKQVKSIRLQSRSHTGTWSIAGLTAMTLNTTVSRNSIRGYLANSHAHALTCLALDERDIGTVRERIMRLPNSGISLSRPGWQRKGIRTDVPLGIDHRPGGNARPFLCLGLSLFIRGVLAFHFSARLA